MCFPRKQGLGRYNANRREWQKAYRAARVNAAFGAEPDPMTMGVTWKAQLIVCYERSGHRDKLSCTVHQRLAMIKVTNDLLKEI
tara:strand:+ start:1322 stop:1573 length:252 start_codon:yes stop_codon:yes gene_type:complete